MNSKPSRLLVPALLVFAALLVSLNAWLGFSAIQSLHDSEFAVAHTWQVINQVESIMSSAKDAETGSRGFLITGDDRYLEPYRIARQTLPGELNQFAALTANNPFYRSQLTELRAVLEQRLNLLQQGIDLRRNTDRETVRAFVLNGTGKVEMDHLRRIADAIEAEERRLLAIRTERADRDNRNGHYIVALASLLDLLFIAFLFRYFTAERAMRLAAEVDAENLSRARQEADARAAEVRSLNESLEKRVWERTQELEAINKELEAFSYSVSHDLRAPLRTIDGFSLALQEDYQDLVDATGRDYIHRVRSGVQRMGQLIDALLQLSRITRAEITRERFNLSELAESVASVLKEEHPAQDIQFNIEPGLEAEADAGLIRVALENLFGNAIKFSSKKPNSRIEFGWNPEKKAYFVRDNGAGFDMYYANKLFNAFNRLHGDKDFRGSGIGLATVARIIHRHHGTLAGEGVVDHGATFWFTLG
ncbi:MAG TPA: CHASE3 domain-containing protein [Edaphobacter sp.]|nr:CHASE3 domain-containing protein [Edaphobacter sp.]